MTLATDEEVDYDVTASSVETKNRVRNNCDSSPFVSYFYPLMPTVAIFVQL